MTAKSTLNLASSKHNMQWQEQQQQNWKNKNLKRGHNNRVMTNKARNSLYNKEIKHRFCLLQATKPSLTFWPSTQYGPTPYSSYIINLFLSSMLYPLGNHNTNRKSLNITYIFSREKPEQLSKTRKAQITMCFSCHQTPVCFHPADKLSLVFDIKYKSNVKISTDWVVCHIKLGAFTPFWKGLMSHIHLFLKQWRLFLKPHRMNNNKIALGHYYLQYLRHGRGYELWQSNLPCLQCCYEVIHIYYLH